MHEVKVQPIPTVISLRITKDGSNPLSLHYTLITRPKFLFVNKISHYMHQPQNHHKKVLKRILCYLVGTFHDGFLFQPSTTSSIACFANADQRSSLDDQNLQLVYAYILERILFLRDLTRSVLSPAIQQKLNIGT